MDEKLRYVPIIIVLGFLCAFVVTFELYLAQQMGVDLAAALSNFIEDGLLLQFYFAVFFIAALVVAHPIIAIVWILLSEYYTSCAVYHD